MARRPGVAELAARVTRQLVVAEVAAPATWPPVVAEVAARVTRRLVVTEGTAPATWQPVVVAEV